MMTRKDYVAIAEALRDAYSEETRMTLAEQLGTSPTNYARLLYMKVVRNVAKTMQADNPRFDADRFIVACGLGGELAQTEQPAAEVA